MRQVLQNLVDGKPFNQVAPNSRVLWDSSFSVVTSLRKRGFVLMGSDTNYTITPQGREALEMHKRSAN